MAYKTAANGTVQSLVIRSFTRLRVGTTVSQHPHVMLYMIRKFDGTTCFLHANCKFTQSEKHVLLRNHKISPRRQIAWLSSPHPKILFCCEISSIVSHVTSAPFLQIFWQLSEDSPFQPFLSLTFHSAYEMTRVIIGNCNRCCHSLTYLHTYRLSISQLIQFKRYFHRTIIVFYLIYFSFFHQKVLIFRILH